MKYGALSTVGSKRADQYFPPTIPHKELLPSELLILNRYGIGYPYITAAYKLSQKYNIPAFEILIRTKVITIDIWLDAQDQLRLERAKVKQKLNQEAFLLNQAINNLDKTLPAYSARKTFYPSQAFFFLILAIVTSSLLYFKTEQSLPVFIVLLTSFYTAMVLQRGYLLSRFQPQTSDATHLTLLNDANLPVYSVLVALYKESNQIDQLTRHLWQLDWPKDKLDIKLICEADDLETIRTIEDAKLPSCFELVIVPPANPRTKPKALNYALPLCHGEFLVLYDAEDMPSPGQLREAYLKFQYEEDELICLQAPLRIHNYKQSWLASMFAIEYATLFNGILPILAKWRVPIPLGGTSNHFNGVM